jgi:hypothetical protein
MSIIRILLALGGLALTALIIIAIQLGDFWQAGAWLTTDPWGLTTLVDLYLGFAISAVVISLYERRLQALLWIVPIPVLGNVWTVIWLIYRLPNLAIRLKSQN